MVPETPLLTMEEIPRSGRLWWSEQRKARFDSVTFWMLSCVAAAVVVRIATGSWLGLLFVVFAPELNVTWKMLTAPTWFARRADGSIVQIKATRWELHHGATAPRETSLERVPAAILSAWNGHTSR